MNFTSFINSFRTLILALVLSIGVSYAYAAWSPPSTMPTGGNAEAPVNVGGSTQVKSGALSVNGLFQALSNVVLAVNPGTNVGIGVASPTEKLDVAGAIKVGDSVTCGVAQAGAIRYNSGTFQGCNGGSWIALSGGVSYTPGSQTWTTVGPVPEFTVPPGVTFVKVTMAGGGGGGAGGNNTIGTGSGGGGGGGYSEYVMTGLTPGQKITNGYVGDGGPPGGYSSGGSDGGNTTFGSLVATGGKGGPYDPGANIIDVGGAGGSPGGQQGGSEGNGVGGNSGAGQGLGGAMGSPGGIYGGGGGGGAESSSPSPKPGAQGWIKVVW